ncbi:SUKH-3 domain-containing protein [Pseudomonas purpurea]|uniref:SUKH-3 domain-containing protein n=1 Tax=Pseudomonas purpurea TaxID=3136737 RepID=UPI003267B374
MPIELSETIRPLFLAAGWPRANSRPLPDFVPADHPAAALLREFDGLHVLSSGAGEDFARGDIAFGTDLNLADDVDFFAWQQRLSTTLIGIAETRLGYGTLLIDSEGACYHMNCISDAFTLIDTSFSVAVENILLGRRGNEKHL